MLSQQSDHVWPRQAQDAAFRRTASVSLWGADFRNLMDHPKVLPYLIELIGPRVRLWIRDYAIYAPHGAEPTHSGGPMRYESDHWYHYNDGTMRNGLMVATWALTDAGPNDGGFVCVPGSHKTNFIDRLPEAVQNQQVMPEYVRQPIVKAGDVILLPRRLCTALAPGRVTMNDVCCSALALTPAGLKRVTIWPPTHNNHMTAAPYGAAISGRPRQGD